jgi:hypothetical protein
MSVNVTTCNVVTICNVPESLLREFMRTIVIPSYPGGISEALQDLMRKEAQKQKKLDSTFQKRIAC